MEIKGVEARFIMEKLVVLSTTKHRLPGNS